MHAEREESMARKTKEEAEKTRQNILDAAFDVFTNKGFMRTTLSDIAATAGVTRGAIYWHFKDKVDLFNALSDEIETSAAARPRDFREERVQSLEDLRREILKYLAHFENNDRYAVFYEMVNYKTEYTQELEPILIRQRENQREILKLVEDLFVRLKAEGSVRRDLNPGSAALSLVALVVGLIDLWLSDRQSFCITEVAPGLLYELFRGIKPALPC
jgi:TetR/AcrR family transcriptional regulator, acrAB operon repressor